MGIEKRIHCISLHVGGVREHAGWKFWKNLGHSKNSLFEGRAPFCEEAGIKMHLIRQGTRGLCPNEQ
jgi:hypothetical protein